MATWVVMKPTVVDKIEAVDKPAAEAIAARRHGTGVFVQSEVSYRITAEERAAVERRRRKE